MRSLPVLVLLAALSALPACDRSGDAQVKPADDTKPAEADRGFVVSELPVSAGDLRAALQAEAAKAKAKGLKPYVEFWATWCGPCQAIRSSLGDPRMIAAFKGAYVIALDADAWSGKLAGTGLKADVLPIFYELDAAGKPTGKTIDGGAWGDNIPENMAPPLDRFFHGT